ncbi:MAG TPA: alpha-ketoacid dehydrogenase subunit beta [Chloroflexota bacterium]|jgi:2-oxoisovalerate dehydrogenase E1 component beta subunit|nr:alpha-ketoacid dehydrogenase subunit beta [Chloroflexota bacterium]
MAQATYLEAISQAMREEMQRDERVYILGEDVGVYGGAFKVTAGFQEEFGESRVIDTPLSESAIVGAAIGSALLGQRPIAEMQFADFIACAFDQIVNMAAKLYYRNGMAVPMVIRGPSGAGTHGGPFHSQSPEGWFAHTPGLKVVVPSTPYDAKGLMKASIRDDDPVIYFEHKYLYRRIKGDLPEEEYTVPIGKADVKRQGADMSVITYGAMVHQSLAAAEELAAEDVGLEVLDLRTILPLDRQAILDSVKKTGKALVVTEDTLSFGVGAEVAAIIGEDGFEFLDGPVMRVAAPDTPVPYAPSLEEAFLPNAAKIAAAARRLAAY